METPSDIPADESPDEAAGRRIPRSYPLLAWITWSIPLAWGWATSPSCGCYRPLESYQESFVAALWLLITARLIVAYFWRSPRSTWLFYTGLIISIWPMWHFVLPRIYVLLVPIIRPELMDYPPFT